MAAWITLEKTVDGKIQRQQVTDFRVNRTICRGDDRFVVEWIDHAGKRRREKVKTAGPEGKRLAIDLLKRIDTGSAPTEQATSWASAKVRYVDTVLVLKRADGTREVIKLALDRFEKLAAPAKLAGITAETIDKFAAKLLETKVAGGEKMRASTVNRHLRCLKGFLRKMVDWDLLPRVPKIAMLDEEPEERPTLTLKQFEAMYRAADKATLPRGLGTCPIGTWWRAALAVYWETGIRRAELLAIEWRNVDFERRCFTIQASGTKTRQQRTCSFGELTARCLQALREHATSDKVFVWPHEMTGLNRMLAKIQTAAGIKAQKHLGFHSARRAVGNTIAEQFGLDVAQGKLGHTTAAVTAKHYAGAAQRAKTAAAAMPVPASLLADPIEAH